MTADPFNVLTLLSLRDLCPEPSTLPKPFVFVLMPFDKGFDDIYKFGIKGAADDVEAYAERIDEQIFAEGMLDRIFNQINKADVLVADMTGRNPNVFYEVGYAHALGKIVLLLTQNTDDIPFDLKHRQHTVYGGSIDVLRRELAPRLKWAIAESRRLRHRQHVEDFSLNVAGVEVLPPGVGDPVVVEMFSLPADCLLPLDIRNKSAEVAPEITHLYLFAQPNSSVLPLQNSRPGTKYPIESIQATEFDSSDGLTLQYPLPFRISPLPPKAVFPLRLHIGFREELVWRERRSLSAPVTWIN